MKFVRTTTTLAVVLLASASIHASLIPESAALNDTQATAQNVDGNFSLDFVANIEGTSGSPSSTTIPHVSITGTQLDTDVYDYYSFSVPAGATLYIDVDEAVGFASGAGNGDSWIRLFRPDGTTASQNDDATHGPGDNHTVESYLSFVTDVPGLWAVGVSPWEFDDPQPAALDGYTLHISSTEVPEPATMSLLAIGGLALIHRKRNR